MIWLQLVNTMSGSAECYGRVISNHKSLLAAYKAARKAQPNQRYNPGAYVPTVITMSSRREEPGSYVPRTAQRPHPALEDQIWSEYAYECHRKGRKP